MASIAPPNWGSKTLKPLKPETYEVFIHLFTVNYDGKDYPVVNPETYAVPLGDGTIEYWTAEQQQAYEGARSVEGYEAKAVVAGYYWRGRILRPDRDEKDFDALDKAVHDGLPAPAQPTTVVTTQLVHNWDVTVRAMVLTYFLAIASIVFFMWQFATVYGG